MKKNNALKFSTSLLVCGFLVIAFSSHKSNAELKSTAKTLTHPSKNSINSKNISEKLTEKLRNNPLNKIKINKSFKTISKFGKKLDRFKKPSEKDLAIIKKFSRSPLPLPKFIVERAVLVSGINFTTKQAVVINSITGKEVPPCNSNENASNNRCKTKLIAPNENVAAALNINRPIKGVIIKNGKEIPATYTVSVIATYEGSWCNTFKASGQRENCNKWPGSN